MSQAITTRHGNLNQLDSLRIETFAIVRLIASVETYDKRSGDRVGNEPLPKSDGRLSSIPCASFKTKVLRRQGAKCPGVLGRTWLRSAVGVFWRGWPPKPCQARWVRLRVQRMHDEGPCALSAIGATRCRRPSHGMCRQPPMPSAPPLAPKAALQWQGVCLPSVPRRSTTKLRLCHQAGLRL